MSSCKVLGEKPSSEAKKKKGTVLSGGEVHRYSHLKARKTSCDALLPWSTFCEVFVTDDCTTGMFAGLSSDQLCDALSHSGKTL